MHTYLSLRQTRQVWVKNSALLQEETTSMLKKPSKKALEGAETSEDLTTASDRQ